jgi:hypothetical protein
MDVLWLLKGPHEARGGNRSPTHARTINVLLFDRSAWALVQAPEADEVRARPQSPDGLCLDPQGRPIYVAGGPAGASARDVLAGFGQQAEDC